MNPVILITSPLALVYASIWIRFLERHTPNRREKRIPVSLWAFFWGGLGSIILIVALNRFILPPLFYQDSWWDVLWNEIVMVGITEEFSKWVVFALIAHHYATIRSPEDAIVQAAAVALAFASVENVLYAHWYGIGVFLRRCLITVPGHMANAAIWAVIWAGVTSDRGGRVRKQHRWIVAAAIIPAGIVHGLYNTSTYFGITAARTVNIVIVLVAIGLYHYLLSHSPYLRRPYTQSRRAIERLTIAIRQTPDSPVLRARLGLHQLYLKLYRLAELNFSRAARLATGRDTPYRLLESIARLAQDLEAIPTENIVDRYNALSPRAQRAMKRELQTVLRKDTALAARVFRVISSNERHATAATAERSQRIPVTRTTYLAGGY